MPRIFIFSSIPGTDINKSLTRLKRHANDKGIECLHIKFEEYLVKAGSIFLRRMGVRPNIGTSYSLTQVLTLPYLQLSDASKNAFTLVVEEIKKTNPQPEAVFISIHPIYYHQQTLEFNSALITSQVLALLKKHKLRIEYLVSIHDDIYDIYRSLIKDGKLLNPLLVEDDLIKGKRPRNPNKDIIDLLFILKWRDHELTASMNKAKSLNAHHLLFHNKGRISSLWRIIWDKAMHVYYSHPIAQPRRDINKQPDPPKSEMYDISRGNKLIHEIQETANNISRDFPIIEPTSIDELRFCLDKLETLQETDLQNKLLPPLTKRWPFGTDNRLGDKHDEEQDKVLLEIADDIYPLDKFEFRNSNLAAYKSALEVLKEEIKRQINVRDHVLAYQANRIIAFRPYSLPDYPKPTGGVLEEIESLIRKIKLGGSNTKPALIVVHPEDDEIRRRKNEFKLAWQDQLINMVLGTPDHLNHLKELILRDISDLSKTIDDIKATIINELINDNIKIKNSSLASSMDSTSLLAGEDLKRAFAEEVLDRTSIMKSAIMRFSETYPAEIKIIMKFNDADDLYRQIKSLIN